MALYTPEMEQYKPFLYVDLDTAIIQSLETIFDLVKDESQFITLEDFWQKDKLATGLVWFPKDCKKTQTVWNAWKEPTGKRMDVFLRQVCQPDKYWQQLTNSIVDFKPSKTILLTELPKEAGIVCFHGNPRIFDATHIKWVDIYVNKRVFTNIQKGYVINLDIRMDRLEEFQKQQFPFKVERFPALTGRTGSIGCIRSHLEILKKADHKFPFIIFEDDCLIEKDWAWIKETMNQLPEDWDMLYLGAHLRSQVKKYSENLYHLQNGKTTHAIVYGSQRVIEYILFTAHESMVIDRFYMEHVQPKFNCFITHPMAATQSASFSNITNGYRNYKPIMDQNYERAIKS